MSIREDVNIESIQYAIDRYNFSIEYEEEIIKLKNHNGAAITIIERSSVINDKKFLICDKFEDYQLNYDGVIREWVDVEKMKVFLAFQYLPFFQHLGGSETISNKDCLEEIKRVLDARNIDFKFKEQIKLKTRVFEYINDSYKEYDEVTKNGFLLFLNENQFLIDLKESFIRLIKIINANEIEIEYNWFSFCPLVKTGKDYVRTVINNFLDFVENIDK
jgi:hypothetical protein